MLSPSSPPQAPVPVPAAGHLRTLPRFERLGVSEQFFVNLRRHTSTNLARVLVLEGAPTPRELQVALQQLQVRHPLLRVRIAEGLVPYYVHGEVPAPRLWVTERRSDTDYLDLLEHVLNTPLPARRGPLLEAHYVYCERTRRGELILVAEHVIGDGVSMNALCGELVALVARVAPSAPRQHRPVLEALLPRPAWPVRARSFAAALASFAQGALQRARHERHPRQAATTSAYAFAELDSAQTRALIAKAREQQTTVTGALMAAVAQAIRRLRRTSPRLALSVPVNMRPRLATHALSAEDLGNYTGVAYLSAEPGLGHWELARSLRAQLQRRTDALPSAVPLIYRMGNRVLRAGRPPAAHAMISNSGVVDWGRDFGTLRVLAFRSATAAPMLSADFALFVNTFDGRLSLNLVFAEQVVTREEAGAVLARIRASLTEAS